MFARVLAAFTVLCGTAFGQAARKSEDVPEAKKVAEEPARPIWLFLPRGQFPTLPTSLSTNDPAVATATHPIDPALDLLRECQKNAESIQGYSATFIKQEVVGNKLGPETYMHAKFRTEPFSVYLKWLHPQVGKEAIYVEGANQNKILTHGTGLSKALTGVVEIDPDSRVARQDSRYSIRELGIRKLIDRLIYRWEFERRFQETEVNISQVKVNDRPCHLITTVHPRPDDGKFMFHTLKVYIDEDLKLPIRVEGYGYPVEPGHTPGRLLECHTYLDVKLDSALTDLDFSTDNPEYSFSRF